MAYSKYSRGDAPLSATKSLRALCGSWEDTNGSAYELWLDEDGSVSVRTTRPSGEVILTPRIIHMDVDDTNILWGKVSARYPFVLGEKTKHSLIWRSSWGGKSFEWFRTGSQRDREVQPSQKRSNAKIEIYPTQTSNAKQQKKQSRPQDGWTQLQSICGTWQDTKGSTYELSLDDDGTTYLSTTRPSGDVRHTEGIIRVDEDDSSQVIWGNGKRAGFVLQAGSDSWSLTWHSINGGKSFQWERVADDTHEEEYAEDYEEQYDEEYYDEYDEAIDENDAYWYDTSSTALLEELCGTWIDRSGSKYVLKMCKEEDSMSVTTTRPSGEVKTTTGMIRLDSDDQNEVVWGKPGCRYPYVLCKESDKRIKWETTKSGGKSFVWERLSKR